MSEIIDHLHRIFLGDQSIWFLIEVAFRTTVIFSYTLFLLRFMGKRGMGQLTPFEFAIIVALGSAVGDPMFYDDVPLVHTMLVIAIVIGLHRLLTILTLKNEAMEKFVEGETTMLVDRGLIILKTLDNEIISKEELFEMLRTEGISQLGEVQHAFMEPSGKLAVIRQEPPREGLSILPNFLEIDYGQKLHEETRCCTGCGMFEVDEPTDHYCFKTNPDVAWVSAVQK